MKKTFRASLKFRAVVASALTLLVFFSIATFGLQSVYKDSLNNAAEGELKAYMLSLLGELDFNEAGEIELFDLSVVAFNQPNSGVFAEVWSDNELLWRSNSLIGKALPKTETGSLGEYRLNSALLNDQEFNMLSLLVGWQEDEISQKFNVVVAHDAQPYIRRQSQFKKRLQLWSIGLGLSLLTLQLLLFRWLFKPIALVRKEMGAIQEGVKQEFSDIYPEEVSDLTKSLNKFLLNERGNIKSVRESLANLAHSLKTPLAVIRSEFSNKATDKVVISENIDRISQVIDYQLNKTSSAVKPSYRQSQPCLSTIEKMVSVLKRLHQDNGVNIKTDIKKPKDLMFKGDLDDLSEILGNVLENACKWAKSHVLVRAHNIDNRLHLLIIDDGPGIAANDVDDVLQRGKRLDSKKEGQGIGLSVVKDIVDSYSGTMKLEDSNVYVNEFTTGLAVSITL